jgi:hypothetical protein
VLVLKEKTDRCEKKFDRLRFTTINKVKKVTRLSTIYGVCIWARRLCNVNRSLMLGADADGLLSLVLVPLQDMVRGGGCEHHVVR